MNPIILPVPVAAVAVFAAAKPWDYWLGLILAIIALVAVAVIGLGYLFKVASLRYYPPGHPEHPKPVPHLNRPAVTTRSASHPALGQTTTSPSIEEPAHQLPARAGR